MKAIEILNKISNIVGVELSQEQIEMAEITLENGTVLVAEKFESGKSIFIKTEEEEIALPVGKYDLEDGKILIVKEEGLIDSIEEAVKEEAAEELSNEEVTEEVAETELEEEKEEEKEEMKYVTKQEFEKAVEEIKGMIEKMGYKDKEEMKEEVQEEVVEEKEKEELSAETAEPIVHNPEQVVEKEINFHISSRRGQTTKDIVFNKLFNN